MRKIQRFKSYSLQDKGMIVEDLILEMQDVKAAHPALEISDVLRIFQIQATRDLAAQTRRLVDR